MIPVYLHEAEAVLAKALGGTRFPPVYVSWPRALAACDAVAALLPWQQAGIFIDRAHNVLRSMPNADLRDADPDGGPIGFEPNQLHLDRVDTLDALSDLVKEFATQ